MHLKALQYGSRYINFIIMYTIIYKVYVL